MIGSRGGEQSILPESFVVDERRVITAQHEFASLRLEPHRPMERLYIVTTPGICMEVVHEVTASDNEHAFVA